MKFSSDIDIDVANRESVLQYFKHTPASIIKNNEARKHNSGIYVTNIPIDPFTGRCSIDYTQAEERGYLKLDILNVGLYSHVKNEQHLNDLMNTEPAWDRLYDESFFSKLIHIGSHYKTLIAMPEAVNSIPRLAMFLAVIRPAKRQLIGMPWVEVAKTVWDKDENGAYAFKKSHSVAYAHMVVVNMNLISASELA
jgi:hypothetical protein